jgi:hypothetical protein
VTASGVLCVNSGALAAVDIVVLGHKIWPRFLQLKV